MCSPSQGREMSEATISTLGPGFESSATATIRETPDATGLQDFESSFTVDQDMDTSDTNTTNVDTTFIVATDFGTTFSSVAFAKIQRGKLLRKDIVVNFPEDPMPNGKRSLEVPTESWYYDVDSSRDVLDEDTEMVDREPVADIFDDGQPTQPVGGGYDGRPNKNGNLAVESLEFMETDSAKSICWGYAIQTKLTSPDVDHSRFKRISRFKLLLDRSENTQNVRDTLRGPLGELKLRGLIERDEDVITDYLTLLFQHTRDQLTTHHELTDSCSIEHVLCVPNIWTSKACRIMQASMETAIRRSGLGSLESLFIISEPEAAATYILDNSDEVNVRLKDFLDESAS
jgi:hypothetical protein